jgi:hypothetical protein
MTAQKPPAGGDDATNRLREAGVDVEALARFLREPDRPVTATAELKMPQGRAAIDAATRGSFLPSDLGFPPDAVVSNNPDLAGLLARCEVVAVGSQRGWQLKPDVRRSILAQAKNDGTLDAISTEPRFIAEGGDAKGRLLRRALVGPVPHPEFMPIEDLERLTTISEWLTDTGLADLPSASELRRIIRKREILDPFRSLVGRQVEAGSDGSNDRFVGRIDEMERLRAYVGIVPPEELRHRVTRALGGLWRTVTFDASGNEPLLVQGIGGMGKSTLLAKFILDHTLFPGVRLPFVYLDSDRAALAPRQPLQLLIDIALQLELWFPETETQLKELRASLRISIDGQAENSERRHRESVTRSELKDFCGKLRTTIEEVNQAQAPVLVLIDTFEVVQYDEDAVQGVTSLISALSARDGTNPWSNFRVVVAGRAEMPEFTTSHKPIILGRLTAAATQALIRRRNRLDDLGLTAEQIGTLARPLRNSPLDVSIVLNWLKSRDPDDRAALIAEMVAEVAQVPSPDDGREPGLLTTRRITGILIDRMIKHINDPEVQLLADPGLVVRAVTPDVIRWVMAPAGGLVESPDRLPFGAEEILFQRFARERWLVSGGGKTVRHRPEVRLAMLDLMRKREQNIVGRESFAATNQRALAYYHRRVAANPSDLEARAEMIYHMLLGGKVDLEEVERHWASDVRPLLSNAVDDLEGLAQAYLKAKLGRRVPQHMLGALPHQLLLSLLLSHGKRILQRSAGAPEGFVGLINTSKALADESALLGLKLEALYRTGRWDDMLTLALRAVLGHSDDHLAEIISTLRRGEFRQMQSLDEAAGDPLRYLLRWAARDERADALWTSEGLKPDIWGPGLVVELKGEDTFWDLAAFVVGSGGRLTTDKSFVHMTLADVGELCRSMGRLSAVATESGALRVLALFEDHTRADILRHVDFSSHFSTVSRIELLAFDQLLSIPFTTSEGDGAYEVDLQHVAAARRGRELLRGLDDAAGNEVIADASIAREFASIVRILVEAGGEPVFRSVARMLALTHPDWLEPMGYALTRAFRGEVPSTAGPWYSLRRYFGGEIPRRRGALKHPSNGHEILSVADEAGNLPAVVSGYVEDLSGRHERNEAHDFLRIAQSFQVWLRTLKTAIG